MPTPLSPSSSQEIIPISPPATSILSAKGNCGKSVLSNPTRSDRKARTEHVVVASSSRSRLARVQNVRGENFDCVERESTAGNGIDRKGKRKAVDDQREGSEKLSRSRVTEQMMSSLGKGDNPITNSDLYSRTDHFVSCATGHQQSNRGGGSAGAVPYWQVRTAKMIDQSREKKTSILSGCLFYINGSTGPKVSNLQLQHLITSNGGRFSPVQSSACTHVVANGGLSGSKSQKWIDGQGGRGAARRSKVVRVEWVLDSVERGMKLSEAGYTVIEDPSQPNLFKTLGVRPKLESQRSA